MELLGLQDQVRILGRVDFLELLDRMELPELQVLQDQVQILDKLDFLEE